jgi:hypothetical protein
VVVDGRSLSPGQSFLTFFAVYLRTVIEQPTDTSTTKARSLPPDVRRAAVFRLPDSRFA